jgi:hypothetical protein
MTRPNPSSPDVLRESPNAGTSSSRLLSRALPLAGLAALLLPLPGCQSISGSPRSSALRVIDASPNAPGIDVYEGGSALAYDLGVGTITSYVSIAPGTYGVVTDQAGTKTQLVSSGGTFLAGSQYTALVGGNLATLQETILQDQSVAAPSGQISVRFIDQNTNAGGVDLYLVPSGSTITATAPIKTNYNFNSNSGYLDITAGTYTLYVLPTGTTPTTATVNECTACSAVTYGQGAARTFFILNQSLTSTTTVQVVTGDDYDSPSSTS